MTREIKFRMWSKEHKIMFNNEALISASQGMIKAANYAMDKLGYHKNKTLPEGLYLPTSDEDAIFMRYTEVNDINNQEIYEGDILSDTFNENVLGVVTYGEYKNPFGCDIFTVHVGFYVDWKTEPDNAFLRKDLGYWAKLRTVKGNIFENPEILG